jgi:hypothetical protein
MASGVWRTMATAKWVGRKEKTLKEMLTASHQHFVPTNCALYCCMNAHGASTLSPQAGW